MDAIRITPETLLSACEVDEFKGLWNALDKHTTGLNLLGDVAGHGNNFKQVLGPLKDQAITVDIIRILHSLQTGGRGISPYKSRNHKPLEIMNGVWRCGADRNRCAGTSREAADETRDMAEQDDGRRRAASADFHCGIHGGVPADQSVRRREPENRAVSLSCC
jgi:hypothetical protein